MSKEVSFWWELFLFPSRVVFLIIVQLIFWILGAATQCKLFVSSRCFKCFVEISAAVFYSAHQYPIPDKLVTSIFCFPQSFFYRTLIIIFIIMIADIIIKISNSALFTIFFIKKKKKKWYSALYHTRFCSSSFLYCCSVHVIVTYVFSSFF